MTSTSTSSVEGLTLPLPSEDEPRWPLAGTITTEMSVSGGPRAGDHRVTIEFDGTQFATVTIDGETMTVDLEERRKGRHHGFGPRSGQGG